MKFINIISTSVCESLIGKTIRGRTKKVYYIIMYFDFFYCIILIKFDRITFVYTCSRPYLLQNTLT
jgi:hypothetical protein